jgi:helicase
LLIARKERERDFLLDQYVRSDPETVQSRLAAEPILRTHALALIANEVAQNEEEVLQFFEKTFYGLQYEQVTIHDKLQRVLQFLQKERFIRRTHGKIQATRLGLRTTQLYIDPYSAVRIREGLMAMKQQDLNQIEALGVLHIVTTTTDMPKLYVGRDMRRIADFIDLNVDKFLAEIPDEYSAAYEFFCREVKTAQLLEAWIEEVSDDRIIDRFGGIGPGDIQRLTESARWLLFSMKELAKVLRIRANRRHLLNELEIRVTHGCKRELLPLVKIPQIGRMRARALVRSGFTSLKLLADADPIELVKVPGIGPDLVDHIKRYLQGDQPPEQGEVIPEHEISAPLPDKLVIQKTLSEFLEKK